MDIKEIMASDRAVKDIIADLKKKSVVIPEWGELKKEYDPKLHPVMDKAIYPDKVVKKKTKGGGAATSIEKVTRITRGWQKLAVKRMSGLMFGIPAQRVYNAKNDKEQRAAEIMESLFTKNRIDSLNRQRAKMLYACCEFVTIWYFQEQDGATYAGEKTKYKLRNRTYTPMQGDSLYPLFDEYGDLIALSIEYGRKENGKNITYFEVFTADEHRRWSWSGNGEYTEEVAEEMNVGKITGIYVKRNEPIWEDESDNVYEAEWALSRNGNYLRKNARPNWVVYCDELVRSSNINKDDDGMGVFNYPSNARAGYETWQQATESLKYHVDTIKQNFFMQLQLPDLSYDNMKSQAMSGESRKMMFIDAQQKCLDESDIWGEALDREVNVVRALAGIMFPQYADAFNTLQVEVVITPFQINDESEKIANLSAATGGKPIMSQRTAVQNLGYVSDVDKELEQMGNEGVSNLFEPQE